MEQPLKIDGIGYGTFGWVVTSIPVNRIENAKIKINNFLVGTWGRFGCF